jgi:hypothetical protein
MKHSVWFFKLLTIIPLFIFVAGCGKISNQVTATFNRVQDFKRSEIITNGPAIADGQSELLVVIHLMNSDGSSVKLFKPTYEIATGTGVSAQDCTTSNDNGISTCVLKATVAGTKKVSVTNIKIDLSADVVFTAPPTNKVLFGLVTASKTQTQGNFKLSGNIGNQEPGAVRTSGAFKLYGGVQGESFSR